MPRRNSSASKSRTRTRQRIRRGSTVQVLNSGGHFEDATVIADYKSHMMVRGLDGVTYFVYHGSR